MSERSALAAEFGEEFAAHVEQVLSDDDAEIDFCICCTCGKPYPKDRGVPDDELRSEACRPR